MVNEIIVERVLEAQAAGTGEVTSSVVDVGGAQGVCIVVAFGEITDGTPVVKVQQGNLANGNDMNDLVGNITMAATTDNNKLAIIDVKKPTKRYVRVVVDRSVGTPSTGSVIDDAIAIKYSGRVYPTLMGTTVANKILLVSPEEVAV